MKKTAFILNILSVFLIGIAFAAEQGFKVEKAEDKSNLRLPVSMKVMQKGMMHGRMGDVAELLRTISKNDLKKAAELAKVKLGDNRKNEELCSMVVRMTGEKEYERYSRDFQERVKALVDAAGSGDRERSLEALSGVMSACNSCHDKFYATALEKNPDVPFLANCKVCHEKLRR